MRRFKHFPCAKCGTVNADYLTFGVGFGDRARHYCLGHIPLWVRIRMRLRERVGPRMNPQQCDHRDDDACFAARCDRYFMDVEVREGGPQGRLVRVERHPRPAEPAK